MIYKLFGLIITVSIYWIARRFYRSSNNKALLSPLFVTPIFLVAFLLWSNIPYESYSTSAKYLTKTLQPATIALAIPLYKNFSVLKKHASQLLLSVFFGSIIAITSSAYIAEMFGLNTHIIDSLIPRTVTAPMAMDISQSIGGTPSITAVFAILTGIIGSLIGPFIIRSLRIKDCIARGVLLGTSSHAAGTTKAFEFGSISGTISSVSMILTGFITIFAAPLMVNFFIK